MFRKDAIELIVELLFIRSIEDVRLKFDDSFACSAAASAAVSEDVPASVFVFAKDARISLTTSTWANPFRRSPRSASDISRHPARVADQVSGRISKPFRALTSIVGQPSTSFFAQAS